MTATVGVGGPESEQLDPGQLAHATIEGSREVATMARMLRIDPASRPSRSRISFGNVICPLLVSVASMA